MRHCNQGLWGSFSTHAICKGILPWVQNLKVKEFFPLKRANFLCDVIRISILWSDITNYQEIPNQGKLEQENFQVRVVILL